MAEERGGEEARLAGLRQKVEGVDEFLRGEVASWRRGSKTVGIVGIIIAIFLAIYFGYLYSRYKSIFADLEGYLEPKTLASEIQEYVRTQLPDVLQTGEEYLMEHSAELIELGKEQLLETLPEGRRLLEQYLMAEGPRLIEEEKERLLEQTSEIRKTMVAYIEKNAGTIVSKSEDALIGSIPNVRQAIEDLVVDYAAILLRDIRDKIDEIMPGVIEENEAEIRKTFEELADPEAVGELKESLKILINEAIDEQVGEELDAYLDILKDIKTKLTALVEVEEEKLTHEQRLEKEVITNLKELIYRKFEAWREGKEEVTEIIPAVETR
ncbi:MAG: hypothetical protein AMS15_01545 [Planctomycetes bacterium DG_23]|nr:MAG: hypothetical protein AMS15_01545 [Planctomycetes bacterium DG_23]